MGERLVGSQHHTEAVEVVDHSRTAEVVAMQHSLAVGDIVRTVAGDIGPAAVDNAAVVAAYHSLADDIVGLGSTTCWVKR